MVWGKDPDEMEEKKGPVPGRDIPISENALKGLLQEGGKMASEDYSVKTKVTADVSDFEKGMNKAEKS